MIGPSAPNGPPVPIAIAEESGFSQVMRAGMRLSLVSTCSMASGIPWPRMARDPQRAIMPTAMPPMAGTTMTQAPSRWPSGEVSAVLQTWWKVRLVTSPISIVSRRATHPTTRPSPMANRPTRSTRLLSNGKRDSICALASA